MYLKRRCSKELIDVPGIETLIDPMEPSIIGRSQAGEEEQPHSEYLKSELVFPSSEPLPICWTDPAYRQVEE